MELGVANCRNGGGAVAGCWLPVGVADAKVSGPKWKTGWISFARLALPVELNWIGWKSVVPGCSTWGAAHCDFPLPTVHCPHWSDGSGLRRPEVTRPCPRDALTPCSLSPDSGPEFLSFALTVGVCAPKRCPASNNRNRVARASVCGFAALMWLMPRWLLGSTYTVAPASLRPCPQRLSPRRPYHVTSAFRAWRPVRVTGSRLHLVALARTFSSMRDRPITTPDPSFPPNEPPHGVPLSSRLDPAFTPLAAPSRSDQRLPSHALLDARTD